ncbi:MAG: AAA family ATPase [Fibromonadaceae bacterium]|jgi:exodeoxyribonuclease V alpha subunit|nr:AAA family ATPase [Fibromonadaceae bacterium]
MERLREFLLKYLETQYGISKVVKDCAERVLVKLEKGSICLKIENKVEVEELKKSLAVGTKDEIRPLIFDGEDLYIQKYFVYQTRILKKIKELLDDKKIHIITGGPGTGKTTSLAAILKNELEKRILLAAPTGKAALRMQESLAKQGIKLEAKTLHRLLGYKHLSVNFKQTKDNPLEADIIAIDECSMIDLPMMSKLLEAVPSNCDLYLLGDKNQLASVEAGSVFADICKKFERGHKGNENIYKELTVNYRAKNAPGIAVLSKQILEGSVNNFNNENVNYFENDKFESELFSWYKDLFSMQAKNEALEFLKTFQILCATKAGKNGTKYINKKLCDIAKKENAKFTPIIITENNYQQNLFNGDVGVKDNEHAYFYVGENEIKAFPALTLPAHDPAFAITIHKSQGSEYERVAVVYPVRENEEEREGENETILTKELLYTAVTRAKKECFICGAKEVLVNSCGKGIDRVSGIK